jgi:hypothetical protein
MREINVCEEARRIPFAGAFLATTPWVGTQERGDSATATTARRVPVLSGLQHFLLVGKTNLSMPEKFLSLLSSRVKCNLAGRPDTSNPVISLVRFTEVVTPRWDSASPQIKHAARNLHSF